MVTTPSFILFDKAHLSAIALTFAVPLVMAAINRVSSDPTVAAVMRWSFAWLLVFERVARLRLLQVDGLLSAETALPMHLCDWAAILVVFTLLRPNQATYELAYFWGLGGSLQALVTPDLAYGFPDPRFLSFFASHGGVVAAVLYLTCATDMRPVPTSIARALGWSLLYLAAAMAVNARLGTNFGYLRARPNHPSLMDYMAPWPWYVLELVPLAVASALVCYSPFWLADWLLRQK